MTGVDFKLPPEFRVLAAEALNSPTAWFLYHSVGGLFLVAWWFGPSMPPGGPIYVPVGLTAAIPGAFYFLRSDTSQARGITSRQSYWIAFLVWLLPFVLAGLGSLGTLTLVFARGPDVDVYNYTADSHGLTFTVPIDIRVSDDGQLTTALNDRGAPGIAVKAGPGGDSFKFGTAQTSRAGSALIWRWILVPAEGAGNKLVSMHFEPGVLHKANQAQPRTVQSSTTAHFAQLTDDAIIAPLRVLTTRGFPIEYEVWLAVFWTVVMGGVVTEVQRRLFAAKQPPSAWDASD